MSDGGKGCRISDNLRTDDYVSEKLGISSRDTYRKEKYIVENQESLTPEDFADWDEGKLSTNKAFKKIKEEKEIKDLIESNLRQRVLGNTNPVKLGRCFEFLQKWYGIQYGNNQFCGSPNNSESITQKQLAEDDSVKYDIKETEKGIQAINVVRTSILITDGDDAYKITLLA